jgi:hypothetical protein
VTGLETLLGALIFLIGSVSTFVALVGQRRSGFAPRLPEMALLAKTCCLSMKGSATLLLQGSQLSSHPRVRVSLGRANPAQVSHLTSLKMALSELEPGCSGTVVFAGTHRKGGGWRVISGIGHETSTATRLVCGRRRDGRADTRYGLGTPVGPVSGWPRSLKTAVSICLGSRHPIVIWWGKETLIQFYSDAYISILGSTKHPWAMGQSARVLA